MGSRQNPLYKKVHSNSNKLLFVFVVFEVVLSVKRQQYFGAVRTVVETATHVAPARDSTSTKAVEHR